MEENTGVCVCVCSVQRLEFRTVILEGPSVHPKLKERQDGSLGILQRSLTLDVVSVLL